MKGTGAKRNVCPGSCVSTGAKFPVAPVESAPMVQRASCHRASKKSSLGRKTKAVSRLQGRLQVYSSGSTATEKHGAVGIFMHVNYNSD